MFKKETANREERGAAMHDSGAYIFRVPEPSRLELRDVEKTFARLFSTDDGKKVLSYLQTITFQRALAPSSTDEQLRYAEGQRAMMATILRLIDRGRTPV